MTIIVGAGPAGIAAAANTHGPVTVIDDNPRPGGQIWRGETILTGAAEFLLNTRVLSINAEAHTLLTENPEGARTLTYSKLILATGSRELFLPFPGWTLPGVFGAGGLQALVKSGLPVRGKRIVVAGSGPLLPAVAALLRKRGANVILIAEQAPLTSLAGFATAILRHPAKLLQGSGLAWALAGVPYLPNCFVGAAEGDGQLTRVHLRRGTRTWTEDCDYAAIGYGLIPNTELHTDSPDILLAPTGDAELAKLEGMAAARLAAGRTAPIRGLQAARQFQTALNKAFALRPELCSLPQPDTIVCRCEDVTFARLRTRTSFRDAKLHTRCGMGPCQSRICGPATRFLFGWQDTSLRPPVFPARIGSLATTEEPSCCQ